LIYVDSNYWIYWLDSRLPEHQFVTRPMRTAISDGILMNYVTLLEVAHHLRSLPKNQFVPLMDNIHNLSTLSMADLDGQTARLALDLLSEYSNKGLGGRDCFIVASMQISNVRKILTHDEAFHSIHGITVEDYIPKKTSA